MSSSSLSRILGSLALGLVIIAGSGIGFAQHHGGGNHGGGHMGGMSHHGGAPSSGMHHYGGFSGNSQSHHHSGFYGGGYVGGFGYPYRGFGYPFGYNSFGVGSLVIGFGVPGYSRYGGYYGAYSPYSYASPGYNPYVGSSLGYNYYSDPNTTMLYNRQQLSAQPQAYSAQSPTAVTSTSDLRPGMVLADGAVVISVDPIK